MYRSFAELKVLRRLAKRHQVNPSCPPHEWLGWSRAEYMHWVETGELPRHG